MPRCAGELDEVRRLERGLGEQDAVVGEDRHRVAVQVREAGDQRGAVVLLELVELRAVDDARDDLAHVVGLARVGRDDAVDLLGGIKRLSRFSEFSERPAFREFRFETMRRTSDEGVRVVQRVVVRDARDARMHLGAAELLGA